MKSKIIFGLIGILIVCFILYYFLSSSSFSGPVGGWEQSKAKIEAKYGYNDQVKLAALQLGEAYQKVIDNPDETSNLKQLDDGMACISGVLVSQGVDRIKVSAPWTDIESLVISTYEQQRRYIHFNAKLSGSMLAAIDPDISKCRFETQNNK